MKFEVNGSLHKRVAMPRKLRIRFFVLICICILDLLIFCPSLSHALSDSVPADASPDPSGSEPKQKVRPGIDILEEENFAPLAGKNIGLITNHTGVDSAGRKTIDILREAQDVRLAAVFTPEHGLSGLRDEKIPSTMKSPLGIPLYSLYGDVLRPTDEMLEGIDVLIFDIQDAGARFYTYITTMAYAMEAAAKKGIPFYVLDRPNPITAAVVQGPVMDRGLKSFTGYFPLPIRHGMTVGELASMFNSENTIGAELHVIEMDGYRRDDWYDETGLAWIPPSPNLRTIDETALYPGVAIVEGSNVSVGRGTKSPFERIGAPWIDAKKLARYMNGRKLSGVRFAPTSFTPKSDRYEGRLCHGIRIILVDRRLLDPVSLGVEIAAGLRKLFPRNFHINDIMPMVGSRDVFRAIRKGGDPHNIAEGWQPQLEQFLELRENYLIY